MADQPRSLVLFLAVIGLCAGACTSTNDASYATADRILAEAEDLESAAGRSGNKPSVTETASAPEVLAATALPCEVETRQDEYGLEFDVCVNADPAASATTAESDIAARGSGPELTTVLLPVERFDELVSAFPSGTGAEELVELGRALAEMDRACQVSLEHWGVELATVTEQLQLAVVAVNSDPLLAGVLGQPDDRELAQAIVERVMIPSGCVDAAPDRGSIGGLDTDSLTELTAAAAAAVEPLYQALWGQPKSPFFYHPDELAHRQWLRNEARLGTDLELVVAGTSQTLLGVEADLLGEQLGLEAGSVALPGAVAEVQQYWLPEVVEAIEPSVVLWGIGPLDLVTICAPDGRAEEFARLSVLKQDFFGRIPAADEIPPLDLIAGSPGSIAYAESPTSLALDRRFPQPRGDAFEFARPDSNQLRVSLEQFRAPFERGDFCSERLPVIEATIAALVGRGHRVVLFGTPIAPSLAATYDGGLEALTGLVDQAAADVFEPAGAEYLGMMTSIDDDGFWYDVVHPTRAGGEALTAELAEALGAGDPSVELPPPGFN